MTRWQDRKARRRRPLDLQDHDALLLFLGLRAQAEHSAAHDLLAWLLRAIVPDRDKAIQGQALGSSKARLLRYEEGCADEEPSQVPLQGQPEHERGA